MGYPKTTTISDLRIYPIKSCRGMSVKSTTLTRQGLKHDRKWMFVDANHKFITIRDKPEMTMIKTSIDQEERHLVVTFPAVRTKSTDSDFNSESKSEPESKITPRPEYTYDYSSPSANTVTIPLDPSSEYLEANTESVSTEIWAYETDAYAYTNPDITSAIREFFSIHDPEGGDEVQLVMKGPTPRNCRGNGDVEHLGREESVNFPDVLPIQVANQASLDELNGRLRERGEGEITIERFRPNIILAASSAGHTNPSAAVDTDASSLQPWEEDDWKLLRINPSATDTSLDRSPRHSPSVNTTTITDSTSSFLSSLTSTVTGALGTLGLSSTHPLSTTTASSATNTDTNTNTTDDATTTTTTAAATTPTPTPAPTSIDIDVSARCARCQVPNVDPTTSIKHKKEPWSVLYSYRRVDEGVKHKPCFGMLCCPRSEGEVKVGMECQIREVTDVKGGRKLDGMPGSVAGEHLYVKGF